MAERRMFAKTIVDSDAFMDMPLSTQALYFHLSMRADDDGFINNPKKISRMIGCSDDDLKLLMAKSFIIPFESGIVVIKHWRINNYIQSDRYHKTVYQEEKDLLDVKDNNAYTLKKDPRIHNGYSSDTECIQDGYSSDTEVSIGKVSIGKVRLDNNNTIVPFSDEIKEIIDYFNQKTGSRYTYKNKTNNSYIKARLEEGHTVEEFMTVIDKKTKAWKGTKMESFLRPETLFCSKHFESYLNEIVDIKRKGSFLDLLDKGDDIID